MNTNPHPSTEALNLHAIQFADLGETFGQAPATRAILHKMYYQKALTKLGENDIPGCIQQLEYAVIYMDHQEAA